MRDVTIHPVLNGYVVIEQPTFCRLFDPALP